MEFKPDPVDSPEHPNGKGKFDQPWQTVAAAPGKRLQKPSQKFHKQRYRRKGQSPNQDLGHHADRFATYKFEDACAGGFKCGAEVRGIENNHRGAGRKEPSHPQYAQQKQHPTRPPTREPAVIPGLYFGGPDFLGLVFWV
jgi:hypothetical protein